MKFPYLHLLSLCLSLVMLFVSCNRAPIKNPPNIVYILADDLGYGDISMLNPNSKIQTFTIDSMARNGLSFTDAHSGSGVCTPTRYGILTGRYAWRSRLKNGVTWSWDQPLIDSSRLTVAQLLKNAGYSTACIGKWHLGLGWQENTLGEVDVRKPLTEGPLNNGFDYFFGITASLDIPPYVYIENNQSTSSTIDTIEANPGKGFWRKGPIGHDVVMDQVLPKFTEKAVEFIHDQKDQPNPFFLYFPLPAPHTPILPLEKFQGQSNTNEYGDFVLMVDDVVKQVKDALTQIGALDNTILIFTSDNGCSPMADFEELAEVGHDPSYIFRGHKADIYEGGHRVPFIVQWPSIIKPDSRYDHPICLTDLLATCAQLTETELPLSAGEDSYDLTPVFYGEKFPIREATVHHSINGSFAIRKDQWKLIFCPGSGGWSKPTPKEAIELQLPPVQLYNLKDDPGEQANLAAEYPDMVDELTQLMVSYIESGRSVPGPDQKNDTPTNLYFAQQKLAE